MKAKRKRKPVKKHWYKLYLGECPVCGSNKSYRERVYGRKPKDVKKQVEYIPDATTYDYCLELG